MGYHYVNPGLVDDPSINVREPEVLVYVPTGDGRRLGAVEYVRVIEDEGTAQPTLFKRDFHKTFIPKLGDVYERHVWLWADNPDGLFEDWNPEVSCPSE